MYAHYLHCPCPGFIPSHPVQNTDLPATGGQLAAKSVKIYRTPDESFSLPIHLSTEYPLPSPSSRGFHLSTASPLAELAANIAVLITCIKLLCLSLHHSGGKSLRVFGTWKLFAGMWGEGGRGAKWESPRGKFPWICKTKSLENNRIKYLNWH